MSSWMPLFSYVGQGLHLHAYTLRGVLVSCHWSWSRRLLQANEYTHAFLINLIFFIESLLCVASGLLATLVGAKSSMKIKIVTPLPTSRNGFSLEGKVQTWYSTFEQRPVSTIGGRITTTSAPNWAVHHQKGGRLELTYGCKPG